MKLRNPTLIRLLGLVIACIFCWWKGTLRLRIQVEKGPAHPADPRRQRFIYSLWHETVLVPAGAAPRLHILISEHADGELIAQVCRHLRIGVVRGSEKRNGARGLLRLLRKSNETHLGMTPDGPRGPRRRVKLGLIVLASRTGLPIVPVGVGCGRALRARSWDRFALPLPWSAVDAIFAPPVHVPPRLDRAGLEQYRQVVESEMLRVTEKAEYQAARRSGVKLPSDSTSVSNTQSAA